ncbi:MAG TPA: hypothetical protein VHB98_05230 [Chloroflexota bacterium]|nr:hypothetical protein [Chloroflexota bacterium]
MNLHPSDVPVGFTLSQRIDGVTTDDVQFSNRSGRAVIDSAVSWLPSRAAAVAAYQQTVPQLLRNVQSAGFTHAMPLALGAVGHQRVGYQVTGTAHGAQVTVDLLIFRQGRYVVSLELGSMSGTVNAPEILVLARIIDDRILDTA